MNCAQALIFHVSFWVNVDGEDNFGLKIESVIGGCNDTWLRNQERVYRQPSSPLKRKKLSEAVFITQSPCQVSNVLFTYLE